MENIQRTGKDSIFGDEPLLDAQGINASWGMTWPRVIARAWRDSESRTPWYQDLMSGDQSRIMRALVAEGFIVSAYSDIESDTLKHLIEMFTQRVRLVISSSSDSVTVKVGDAPHREVRGASTMGYDPGVVMDPKPKRENAWKDANGLEHVLVLTLPPKPAEQFQAIADADYVATGRVYPFTFCC